MFVRTFFFLASCAQFPDIYGRIVCYETRTNTVLKEVRLTAKNGNLLWSCKCTCRVLGTPLQCYVRTCMSSFFLNHNNSLGLRLQQPPRSPRFPAAVSLLRSAGSGSNDGLRLSPSSEQQMPRKNKNKFLTFSRWEDVKQPASSQQSNFLTSPPPAAFYSSRDLVAARNNER